MVLADAIEDARRIRERIDALADAATELLRDVRREADRLTAELGFEPELLQGVVEIDSGTATEPGADAGIATPDDQAAIDEPPAEADGAAESTADEIDPGAFDRHSGASHETEQEPGTRDEPIDQDEEEHTRGPEGDSQERVDSDRTLADAPQSGGSEAKPSNSDLDVDDAVVVDDNDRDRSAKAAPVPCEACDTTGQCSRCKGTGRRARLFRCGKCDGSGRCNVCGGPGYVWDDRG